jgi:hypothetical protein
LSIAFDPIWKYYKKIIQRGSGRGKGGICTRGDIGRPFVVTAPVQKSQAREIYRQGVKVMNLIEPRAKRNFCCAKRRLAPFSGGLRDYREGASRISPIGGFSIHRRFRGSWIDVPPIRDGGHDKKK